jgi:hypothetical protein
MNTTAKCGGSCSTSPPNPRPNMASEYLVAFGRAGHLGRFQATGDLACHRGDRVVIHGVRGIELGEVLGLARQTLPDPHVGELLRIAGDDDEVLATTRERLSRQLCVDAETIANQLGLSLAILDAEVTLDGRGAVLHTLAGSASDAGPLLDQLAERHGLIVRLYDLASENPRPADAPDALEEFKCDKPDCGQGNCSEHGGCSTCSAGGAKELESYFAELREKMETRNRVPLA